ncbi:MAG: SDR family oxidoreductase [Candidatus Schekmanbacteria bacterium]|nr:SDR family oxidoreductase [Candidatus Schekmanbacteria bacterium]
MDGKTCVVTGATSGIGRETAKALHAAGANLVFVARDRARAEALATELSGAGGEVSFVLADLSSLGGVRRAAAEIRGRCRRLEVLVNNAGAMFTTRSVTADGYERTFALNHLSYFLFTAELRELLAASAPARIVSVASDAHRSGAICWEDLQLARSYPRLGWTAYCQSKLANVMFTCELSRRLEATGVTANAVHPGFVATAFLRNNGVIARLGMALSTPFARTPEQGADTVIWAATARELTGASGKYLTDRKIVSPSRASRDESAWRRLWEVSEELVGARSGRG